MVAPPVFLKQYGEKRTGTNYLRALLNANYANAKILMHVLGDKHSPPVNLRAIRAATLTALNPAEAFVWAATLAAPSETTVSDCLRQQEYVLNLSESLAAAQDKNKIFFITSILSSPIVGGESGALPRAQNGHWFRKLWRRAWRIFPRCLPQL